MNDKTNMETPREVESIEDIMKLANGEMLEEIPAKQDETQAEEVIPSTESVEEVPATEDQTATVDPELQTEDAPTEPYVPTFSYSVKGEEKQFDERLQSIIKTKEDEDYIRELMTKSDGLDSYKEKFDIETSAKKELEESLADINEKLSLSQGFYQNIVAQRDGGDWRGAQKSIGYDDDAILKMAIEIARERELPAEQQQSVQLNRQLAEQNRMLAANQQLVQQNSMQQQENALANSQTAELNGLIGGEYSDLNETMTANGLNMFNEAIAVGHAMFNESLKANPNAAEPSTAHVLKATAEKYAFMTKVQEPAPEPAKPAKQAALPRLGSGNSSQVGDSVSSVEDLQKMLNSFNKNSY